MVMMTITMAGRRCRGGLVMATGPGDGLMALIWLREWRQRWRCGGDAAGEVGMMAIAKRSNDTCGGNKAFSEGEGFRRWRRGRQGSRFIGEGVEVVS